MSRAFARLRLGGMRPTLAALKTLVLGLLALWYALLPVTLIDDASSHWRLYGTGALPLGAAISSLVVAGVMAARLMRVIWLGPVSAAVVFVILEAGRHARWANGFTWWMDIAILLVMASIWVGCAIAVATQLRRRAAPMLGRHSWLQATLIGLASVATGLIVLLHPGKLLLLLHAIPDDVYDAWSTSSDTMLAMYYGLGGLAAGFTLRLLWPAGQRLSRLPALTLVGLWCALATRTLLDSQNSNPWPYTATLESAPPFLLLLAVVGAAVVAGLWLAHRPSTWSRDA